MTMIYEVTHRTEYDYDSEVADSYALLHLLPREHPGQRCRSADVVVVPAPEDHQVRVDYFGNRVSFVAIHRRHRALRVTATSVVEVDEPPAPAPAGERPWEEVRDGLRTAAATRIDAGQFRLDSPLVASSPALARYARRSFPRGRPLHAAVAELTHRIHDDFAYRPGSTSVTTPVAEVLERREGVCQDFAHLEIACLRSLGLAARYVSGYLETDPPPGRPKLKGADGSHAWLSVLVPGGDWIEIDPTNDQLANSRYIVTAYGRDYSDVPPLSGVIYTESKSNVLRVVVDVVALAA